MRVPKVVRPTRFTTYPTQPIMLLYQRFFETLNFYILLNPKFNTTRIIASHCLRIFFINFLKWLTTI
ncbi:MAG: hypothetical protein BWY21_01606 [Parcubacteria group bacterium ADurb.Bin216]|nr:MAG: hypothetical protein BWY21_01606 [Parcubacteria group bacterium ADurb.Bin216]